MECQWFVTTCPRDKALSSDLQPRHSTSIRNPLHQQKLYDNIKLQYTGRFIMFSVITNIYNKKTKGPTLMEFFTAIGRLKKFFFI